MLVAHGYNRISTTHPPTRPTHPSAAKPLIIGSYDRVLTSTSTGTSFTRRRKWGGRRPNNNGSSTPPSGGAASDAQPPWQPQPVVPGTRSPRFLSRAFPSRSRSSASSPTTSAPSSPCLGWWLGSTTKLFDCFHLLLFLAPVAPDRVSRSLLNTSNSIFPRSTLVCRCLLPSTAVYNPSKFTPQPPSLCSTRVTNVGVIPHGRAAFGGGRWKGRWRRRRR